MKRRLCAFLAAALCAACLTTAALAGDESLHTDYVEITCDGFAADSLDGVEAIYNLTTASPDCLDYVQRYYREVYGLELQAVGHNIWITNDDTYYFERTSDPQPGISATRLPKSASAAAGTTFCARKRTKPPERSRSSSRTGSGTDRRA